MILLCVNELAGTTGYHKSVVETANALHRGGYPLAVLSMLGPGDGAIKAMPRWPLEPDIPALVLQNLVADGGRILASNVHAEVRGRVYSSHFAFTSNQLAALRQINDELTSADTIVFTSPIHAVAFHHALVETERRPRTVLQVHGDYRHHDELWALVDEARDTIDTVQTVATGLMDQFVPKFSASDIVCVPNIHHPAQIRRAPREGVEIVLPASFQHRKNQLEAIRALSLIEDESVHLTLWGNISPLNPYFIAVRELIDSLGLQDRVEIPGFGTEQDVYSSADIVLMTSLSEGFGYPLLEAAYHELPAVTYDYEFGPRDAVEDGESGYIVPVGDIEGLADRLRTLAADASLRQQFGRRAREIFDERFSAAAVVDQYGAILGPPGGEGVDIAALLSSPSGEPIAADQISQQVVRAGIHRYHRVTVDSDVELYDVLVDDGEHIIRPEVTRSGDVTLIEFPVGNREVISYTTEPGSPDRHYLAGPAHQEKIPVLPRLRRDADYGDGEPPVVDSLYATRGGAGYVSVRGTSSAFVTFTRDAIEWKIRQLVPALNPAIKKLQRPSGTSASGGAASSSTSAPGTPTAAATVASAADGGHESSDQGRLHGLGKVIGLPVQAMSSLGRVTLTFGKTATRTLVRAVLVKQSAPALREIPRHPHHPVSAGVDSFGAPINTTGGVKVQNTGAPIRPTLWVQGEYDWLDLRDGKSKRRITPPWSYGELFERICEAEREHGLFDITTKGGVHLWELGRSALVIQLAEAAGLWGQSPTAGGTVKDVYTGKKRLTTAPSARTVVFDYVRRGQGGYRTAPFVNDQTLFVVQPEADGYPGVTETNMVYPFAEFNEWKKKPRQRWTHLRIPEVDARPFEEALTDALGININLGDHLRNRLAKFLAEREFWTPVFERVAPEEVLIASSHWWAGIAAAAHRSGAQVSDIQYALTSHYAPSFWFGQKPHYGASRFYAWSDFWAERTNVYQEHVVVPREQPELVEAIRNAPTVAPRWDVCVVAQPRVLRRILAFVQDIVRERPDLSVVIAPHPAQRATIEQDLATAGLTGRVSVAEQDTLSTIVQSEVAVGTFSTSLWESAAIGRPTYVIEVPGYEETLQDIDSGLFRFARTPHDLVPFEVPASRTSIFGL